MLSANLNIEPTYLLRTAWTVNLITTLKLADTNALYVTSSDVICVFYVLLHHNE